MKTKCISNEEFFEMFIEDSINNLIVEALPEAIEHNIPQMPVDQQKRRVQKCGQF